MRAFTKTVTSYAFLLVFKVVESLVSLKLCVLFCFRKNLFYIELISVSFAQEQTVANAILFLVIL